MERGLTKNELLMEDGHIPNVDGALDDLERIVSLKRNLLAEIEDNAKVLKMHNALDTAAFMYFKAVVQEAFDELWTREWDRINPHENIPTFEELKK